MQRAALGGARRGAAPAGAAEMRGGGRRGAAHARQSPAGGGPRRQRKPKNTVRGGRGRPRRGARGRHAGAGAGQGGATAPLALAGHGGAGQEGERLEGGRSPLFGLRFAAPLLAPAAAVASAWGAAPHCLVPALVFVAVPLLDVALGEDRSPPAGGGRSSGGGLGGLASASSERLYRLAVYAFAVAATLQLGVSACAFCQAVGEGALAEAAALALSAGVVGGLGINAAHELCHGRPAERRACRALLACWAYTFWATSHLAHHALVGLPGKDCATATRHETVWGFAARAPGKNLGQALAFEERKGRPRWRALCSYAAAPAAIAAALTVALGPAALVFYVAQAAIAVFLLEAVNFLEHYGLERADASAAVTPALSWNASWPASNALLFNLQRHSDHHSQGRAGAHYQTLRDMEPAQAPRLPHCYPTMILLSLVPPLFAAKMDTAWKRYQAASAETGIGVQ